MESMSPYDDRVSQATGDNIYSMPNILDELSKCFHLCVLFRPFMSP